MLREPSGLLHPAKICLAAKIGRSEMGEGPTNPSFNSRVKLFGTPGLRPELDFFLLGNGLTGLGLVIGTLYSSSILLLFLYFIRHCWL